MKTRRWFTLGIAVAAMLFCGNIVTADTLLFSDGFNPPSGETSLSISYQWDTRQAGTMAPADYEERADTKYGQLWDNMSQLQNWGQWGRTTPNLDLGAWGNNDPDNSFTWASPIRNFNVGRYEVGIKMSVWAHSGGTNEAERYAGILFGADAQGQRARESTSGLGLILTGNYKEDASGVPTWALYDRGVMVASGYLVGPDDQYWEDFRILVDNTGSTAKVSVWDHDISLVSNYVSSYKLNNNYITLGSYNNIQSGTSLPWNWGMFDDLTVTEKSPDYLTGHVELQDYDGDMSVIAVRMQFMQGGNVIASRTPVLDQNGNYTVTGLTSGTYDVAFKTSQSLKTVVQGVAVPGICDVSLRNGDLDGDNQVTSTDLSSVLVNIDQQGD